MQDQYVPNTLHKIILQKIYQQKSEDTDILTKFCDILSHSHIKLYVYNIIIQTIESTGVTYRIKENEITPNKCIFTLIVDSKKNKVVEIEINGKEIFCTSFPQLCIAKFIPLVPMKKVMIREISEIIVSTIEIQQEYMKLSINN
jgi:hypothetical protein